MQIIRSSDCLAIRMKIYLSVCCMIVTVRCLPEPITQIPGYTQLSEQQVKHLQNRGFGSTIKTFGPTEANREEEEEFYEDDEIDSDAESSQDRAPTYANQNYPVPIKATLQPIKATLQPNNINYPIPVRTSVSKGYPTPVPEKRFQQQKQYLRRGEELQAINKLEEEKEEEEEPDRLSLLLPQSKFTCSGRNTGYYADEDLGCEVFHYCQENSKHSWICPEGFTFHQVHLICMPPGGDNICEKSSDYHFVNDFLYKPVNLEEYQQKPNITLRYSDRYYPEQYRTRYNEDDDAPVQHQHSIRVTGQPRFQYVSPTTLRPQQVYRSPEEINISLQQRRPSPQPSTQYEEY
ncbi:uncharacterized protein LOC114338951 isoform X1 [Diabrotica virgifera virgifera]|uniref:Chitin-binding type-2 domain-containing protein n=2 Tax=Diabrotica virgifera virgifera TaxID=50390 RepID=A0ABM5K7Y2_DIAVI|nr:uncharacterized protein LOC114338951 isoform X1 [Diabrotica virgifera virgifera]